MVVWSLRGRNQSCPQGGYGQSCCSKMENRSEKFSKFNSGEKNYKCQINLILLQIPILIVINNNNNYYYYYYHCYYYYCYYSNSNNNKK